MTWVGSPIFDRTAKITIKPQSSDVSCLELPLILKLDVSTPAVHAFYPQVFLGKGDANFSFCFSHHLARIESIDQSKGCKINHIVYDPSTSRDSRLLTDCEPGDRKLRRTAARFSSQNQLHSARSFGDDARTKLKDLAAQGSSNYERWAKGIQGDLAVDHSTLREPKDESLKFRKRPSRW